MDNILVAGFSGLLITIGLTEAFKRLFELDQRGSVLSAFVVAEVLTLGSYFAGRYPAFGEVWVAIITGVVLALASMGLWSGAKALSGR